MIAPASASAAERLTHARPRFGSTTRPAHRRLGGPIVMMIAIRSGCTALAHAAIHEERCEPEEGEGFSELIHIFTSQFIV